MRAGTHVGLEVIAIPLLAAKTSVYFGSSVICAEIGITAGIEAKAALRVLDIYND
jgi:hypothetical protein